MLTCSFLTSFMYVAAFACCLIVLVDYMSTSK